MTPRLLPGVLAATVALALPAAAASSRVAAEDNVFAPASRTVAVGDTVTFANTGTAPHEVTAADGSFASGNIAPGASWSYTAGRAGTFRYYCRYHGTATSGMTGTLVVSASTGPGLPQTGGGRQVRTGLAVLLATAAAGLGLRAAKAGAR